MWITLAAMTASASMILVDQTAVPLATPHAVEDLGASMDEGQWIMTANILPLAPFMVLGGRLGDLFGLRKVFLIGAFTFGIATAFAGFAQDMPLMIGARGARDPADGSRGRAVQGLHPPLGGDRAKGGARRPAGSVKP